MVSFRAVLCVAMLAIGCNSHLFSNGSEIAESGVGAANGSVSSPGVPVACDCHDVTCALPCPPPLCTSDEIVCSSSCVDTQIDPTHCGYCSVTCAAGQGCRDGTCVPAADAAPMADAAPGVDAAPMADAAPGADAATTADTSSDGTTEAESGVALDASADAGDGA
jgi:hypothetical protein